ncbi:MAG TPA: rhamnulokinase family protein [Spirochaetia bacterium]|nr:rhamnulokinase family protein [Spirochaetia bacterium]
MGTSARVIATDIGASGGKCFAGVFDGNGFSLREVHRFSHEPATLYMADRTGKVEERTFWDELYIYSQIVQGLRAYRRDVSDAVDSIGIDAWGTDGALVTEDGVTLGHVYSYRDHRLDGMVDQVKARLDARRMYEITGIHFQPFNLSNQLLWLVQNRAGLLKKGVRFLPITTLFSYCLGGVTAIDSSWASVSQLMDSKKRKWSREILRALGIPPWLMPEIVAPGAPVGELRAELAASLGLNRARILAVGSHDTASAYAAAPIGNPANALIISSGTWSLVGKLVRKPITTEEAMAANISNEGGIGNIRLLKNCMGTWLVQELRRAWRGRDGRELDWDEMNRMTEKGAPLAAFIDPDDPGFYNPSNMEEAITAFCRRTGQEAPRDRGTMLRAVYESLALKYRMVAEQIAAVSGKPSTVVHIVGGGSRNVFLNQLAANACGVKVVAGPEEATAVGNAMVQAMGLGVIAKLSDARSMIRAAFPIREFAPRDRETWEKAYARFRTVVK